MIDGERRKENAVRYNDGRSVVSVPVCGPNPAPPDPRAREDQRRARAYFEAWDRERNRLRFAWVRGQNATPHHAHTTTAPRRA